MVVYVEPDLSDPLPYPTLVRMDGIHVVCPEIQMYIELLEWMEYILFVLRYKCI